MKTTSFLSLLLVALLSACGSGDIASNSIARSSNEYNTASPDAIMVSSREADASLDVDSGGGGGGGRGQEGKVSTQNISLTRTAAAAIDTSTSDRKIIRNAELSLEAENPEDSQRKITAIAELKGGFVVESQQSVSDVTANSRDIVTMTVRIPAARFSETLSDIRNVSSRVVAETIKGQDVTEEFIDIEAQLRAKKALEQQFMEIMKRASSVDDALSVQRQLADVRGEIERVEGRKRFLENQSSLSTIRIRLQTAKVFAATSVGFGDRLSQSFMAGANVAVSFVLGLITAVVALLPFAFFIGLPVFLLFRYVWKRPANPSSVVDLAEEELKIT